MAEQAHYRGVSAIPVNAEGKILLQQRDHRPGLSFPGHWTTFGGQVEDGETPDEAMRRELMEEIGIELPLKLWRVYNRVMKLNGRAVIVENHVYVGRIGDEAEQIRLNEGQAYGFFSLDELDGLQIGFGFESLFREFFAVYQDML